MSEEKKLKILDVGPGYYKYPGSVGIDFNSLTKADIVHDLNKYPWPIADNEYDLIYSSHCLEHLAEPKKAIEEIWRVGRDRAQVIIKVPHFSSRVAWTDIEHTRAFAMHIFRRYSEALADLSGEKVKFKEEKIILRWHQRLDKEFLPGWARLIVPLIELANGIISFFANLNADFCERIWCYYVGGMGEVEFRLRIIKKK